MPSSPIMDSPDILGGAQRRPTRPRGFDHDPSGAHLFLAMAEDVRAFADYYSLKSIELTRLAVTPEQIEALSLSTAPAKPTDRRAFIGETCQAEAIAPDVLAQIVLNAIAERFDHGAWQAVIEREPSVRQETGGAAAPREVDIMTSPLMVATGTIMPAVRLVILDGDAA